MNEIIVTLPAKAIEIRKDIESIPVIEVVDEKTNIAATENLKIVNQYIKEFDAICEPERLRLITPLNQFYALRKTATDMFENWIKNQKLTIGKYGQEMIRIENEKRRIEQEKLNEQRRIETERQNELRRVEQERINAEKKAEIDRLNEINAQETEGAAEFIEFVPEEIKQEEFIPIQEPILQNESKVKSVFASGSVKLKPFGTIIDIPLFLLTLIDSNESAWIKLIFDKVNQSKLNDFLKSHEINGDDKKYPGVHTEMKPDVRSR